MAKQTETKVPHPTTIQFTATYSFVKIGTNPPNSLYPTHSTQLTLLMNP